MHARFTYADVVVCVMSNIPSSRHAWFCVHLTCDCTINAIELQLASTSVHMHMGLRFHLKVYVSLSLSLYDV